MGSSNKKKKEKAKDFQVCTEGSMKIARLQKGIETEVQGRKGQGKGFQLHRHQLQIKGYV